MLEIDTSGCLLLNLIHGVVLSATYFFIGYPFVPCMVLAMSSLWILSFLSVQLRLLSSVMSMFCDSFVHVHSQVSGTRSTAP
jgi:hypothetical protein